MGGHAYWYIVPYRSNLQAALDDLRDREFTAGRYNPAIRLPRFPVDESAATAGARHLTIAAAVAAAEDAGTRSILDVARIGTTPDIGTATPLDAGIIEDLYGTTHPTRDMVESNMDFWEFVARGHAVYVVLYDNGEPSEICFAGYSFD